MQLARNVFPEQLPRAKKLSRKICEIRLAPRLEDEFSKEDVLELYLNQVYLGSGLYGVEAAAEGYFGKSVSDVTTAEAALLIGLAKSPEGYNPRRHPLRAVQRRNVVLSVMAREGVITPEEAEKAKAEPIRLAPPVEARARRRMCTPCAASCASASALTRMSGGCVHGDRPELQEAAPRRSRSRSSGSRAEHTARGATPGRGRMRRRTRPPTSSRG